MQEKPETAETKIEVRNLTKVFGAHAHAVLEEIDRERSKSDIHAETGQVVAVREASFDVRRGEVFVVMGLSGSGKSTLVRMLNRLIEPTRGKVRIDGRDILQMPRKELIELRRRDIAMVFQSFALMPHMTNLENAAFGLDIAGVAEPERSERANRALETVGLAAFAHSHPYELSGGMQQRVGLARALSLDPTIMLMDEAFSALDPLIRTEMQEELLTIQRERDITIVFISHDLKEALRIGDRLAIMDDGVIVQVGTPREIVAKPANDYVRDFFQDVDIRQVLTARDIAEDPAPVFETADGAGLESLAARLDRSEARQIYLRDSDGRFQGTADGKSIAAAQTAGKSAVDDAILREMPTLAVDQRLADLIHTVAAAPYPVPVLDGRGHLQGVVSRASLLAAMETGEKE